MFTVKLITMPLNFAPPAYTSIYGSQPENGIPNALTPFLNPNLERTFKNPINYEYDNLLITREDNTSREIFYIIFTVYFLVLITVITSSVTGAETVTQLAPWVGMSVLVLFALIRTCLITISSAERQVLVYSLLIAIFTLLTAALIPIVVAILIGIFFHGPE